MTIFFTVPPIGMINGIFLIGFYAPVVCSLYPDTRYTTPVIPKLFDVYITAVAQYDLRTVRRVHQRDSVEQSVIDPLHKQ